MMEIVTVWLLYTVTILIKYRHYFVEENLLVKYPSVSLSFMIETSQYLHPLYLIPPIPNCSINTFFTFGERKAGSVGPK